MNNLTCLLPLILLACGDDTTIDGITDSDTDTDTDSDTDTDTDTDTDAFVFATDAASAYTRVDRMGMPAVATAVIASDDDYNAANPTDDAAGDFVGEITDAVTFLHDNLDDDLAGLLLTPCAVADCVGQAAPYVVPDVLTLDTSVATGFPNGRSLPDTVIDVTLALILLDLTVHPVTALVGVNPTANDLAFPATFPYLAAAQ